MPSEVLAQTLRLRYKRVLLELPKLHPTFDCQSSIYIHSTKRHMWHHYKTCVKLYMFRNNNATCTTFTNHQMTPSIHMEPICIERWSKNIVQIAMAIGKFIYQNTCIHVNLYIEKSSLIMQITLNSSYAPGK